MTGRIVTTPCPPAHGQSDDIPRWLVAAAWLLYSLAIAGMLGLGVAGWFFVARIAGECQ